MDGLVALHKVESTERWKHFQRYDTIAGGNGVGHLRSGRVEVGLSFQATGFDCVTVCCAIKRIAK